MLRISKFSLYNNIFRTPCWNLSLTNVASKFIAEGSSATMNSSNNPGYFNRNKRQRMNNLNHIPSWYIRPNYFEPYPPPPPPRRMKCGEPRLVDEGCNVEIKGRVNQKRLNRFIELKDDSGIVQLVATDQNPDIEYQFNNIPLGSFITVVGFVKERNSQKRNKIIPTGGIEIDVRKIVTVNKGFNSQSQWSNIITSSSRNYTTRTESDKACPITSIEYQKASALNCLKFFENRVHNCGNITEKHLQSVVNLVGWFEKKRFGKFLSLRDGYGQIQLVLNKDDKRLLDTVDSCSTDTLLHIRGIVLNRPSDQQRDGNECLIEIVVDKVHILTPQSDYNELMEQHSIESDLIVNDELKNDTSDLNNSKLKINAFTYRTHNCGELSLNDVGKHVTLCGWLEFQRMRKFFTLRDAYGVTQVIVPQNLAEEIEIESIPFESIIKVNGVVTSRPPNMVNKKIPTGEIEVTATDLEVLNPSRKDLPISVREFNRSKETQQLEYRYLDLRFPDMQQNLRMRSNIIMKMREYLINQFGFVEVETPTLFRRTPGGAQEFVVPTRKPGLFYSLVQSPQQFKQILMSGAIDRYFQIARCYRDEATRPDRQPEFTQLDIELSFTDRDGIINLIEGLISSIWPTENGIINKPFPKLTYNDAMERYGTDKPDTRFGLELQNVTSLVKLNEELVTDNNDFGAFAIVIRSPMGSLPNRIKQELTKIASQVPSVKFVSSALGNQSGIEWAESDIKNLLSVVVTKALAGHCQLGTGDLLLLTYGPKEDSQLLLGRIRLAVQNSLEERELVQKRLKYQYNFLWVTDFPMFCIDKDTGVLSSVHHPFTAPHPDDLELLTTQTNLFNIRSQAYDLVLNGEEIGGGSIRIHNSDLQKKVLQDILNIKYDHLQHLLDALASGCPPHGGIALGIDRLMAIICNARSIKDVMAFPKGLNGKDHMSKAPVSISDDELNLYHIKVQDLNAPTENCTEETK